MELLQRDSKIIDAVASFVQLRTDQVRELVFDGLASRTPADRRLRSLVGSGHLGVVPGTQGRTGGPKGGGGPNVYYLGREGHRLYGRYKKEAYRPSRTVKPHQLLLADSYLEIRKMAKSGVLAIDGMSMGDDAAVVVGQEQLRPDMRLDVTRLQDSTRFLMWLEVDMGTEGVKQVKDKLQRYWRAVHQMNPEEWPYGLPRVIWIAVDLDRARELRWIIDQHNDESFKSYFIVTTCKRFPSLFMGAVDN